MSSVYILCSSFYRGSTLVILETVCVLDHFHFPCHLAATFHLQRLTQCALYFHACKQRCGLRFWMHPQMLVHQHAVCTIWLHMVCTQPPSPAAWACMWNPGHTMLWLVAGIPFQGEGRASGWGGVPAAEQRQPCGGGEQPEANLGHQQQQPVWGGLW